MCRAVCYSGNRGQTNNEAGAWRQGFQFSLPTPPQPRAIPPAARFQLGASRGEWPLQPFPSRSGWGSREQKCQGETLLSFKGPPGWDGGFWKGKVESGDMGRGRYVPGMPGRQRIMEDGSSKGRHPHSKSSCRREAAGAAETGFLAPSRVAWAGSADLQNGIDPMTPGAVWELTPISCSFLKVYKIHLWTTLMNDEFVFFFLRRT